MPTLAKAPRCPRWTPSSAGAAGQGFTRLRQAATLRRMGKHTGPKSRSVRITNHEGLGSVLKLLARHMGRSEREVSVTMALDYGITLAAGIATGEVAKAHTAALCWNTLATAENLGRTLTIGEDDAGSAVQGDGTVLAVRDETGRVLARYPGITRFDVAAACRRSCGAVAGAPEAAPVPKEWSV